MKKILTFVLLFLSVSSFLKAEKLPYGEITKYGVVEILDEGTRYTDEDSLAGYAHSGAKAKFIAEATTAKLYPGVSFGFEWCAYNLPNGKVQIQHLVEHPPIQKPGKPVSTSFLVPLNISVSEGRYCTEDFYQLSEPWEQVPGKWKLAVLFNGITLVEKTFDITKSH